jgi:hypothetical protein
VRDLCQGRDADSWKIWELFKGWGLGGRGEEEGDRASARDLLSLESCGHGANVSMCSTDCRMIVMHV